MAVSFREGIFLQVAHKLQVLYLFEMIKKQVPGAMTPSR